MEIGGLNRQLKEKTPETGGFHHRQSPCGRAKAALRNYKSQSLCQVNNVQVTTSILMASTATFALKFPGYCFLILPPL
jgi:hypothetical protein